MARPRKSDQTREQLLVVGTELLTNHGYHGTGIKQILDAVGVPKGSFYNFFPSKEAFVATAIYRYGEQVELKIEQATRGLENEAGLVQLWCSFRNKVQHEVEAGQSCACLLGTMSAGIAQNSPLCHKAIAVVEQQWVVKIQAGIELAQQQGDMRDDLSAEKLAPTLYNCWQGSLLQYQLSGNADALMQNLWIFFTTLMTPQGHLTFTNSSACERELHYDK